MLSNDYCSKHGSQVIYFTKKTDSNQLIGLCEICAAEVTTELILAEDLQRDVDNKRNELLTAANREHEEKIYNLQNFVQQLKQYQYHQKHEIEKIEDLTKQIESIMENQLKNVCVKLNNFKTFDERELINVYKQNVNQINEQQVKKSICIHLNFLKAQYTSLFEISQQFTASKKQYNLVESKNVLMKAFDKCQKHQEKIIGIDLESKYSINRIYCAKCPIQDPLILTSINDAQSLWFNFSKKIQNQWQQFQSNLEDNSQYIDDWVGNKIFKIKQKLDMFRQKIFETKILKIRAIENRIEKLNRYEYLDFSVPFNIQKLIRIKALPKYFLSKNDKLLSEQIAPQKNFKDLDTIFAVINQLSKQLLCKQIDDIISDESNFQYQLKSKLKMKSDEQINTISLSSDRKVLVAGIEKSIIVFDFNGGKLVRVQEILGHLMDVYCLQFIKQQNTFVSGSYDRTIKIWSQDKQKRWNETITLKGHTNAITCLIVSNNGNLIISGSVDKKIKFWFYSSKLWKNQQTISAHSNCVHSICLNLSENKLISCSEDRLILIMKGNVGSEWTVTQKIQTEYGFRLCFTAYDNFVFQLNQSQKLNIFVFDSLKQNFQFSEQVVGFGFEELNNNDLFPQLFSSQKQILMSKSGSSIMLFQQNSAGLLKKKQIIEFDCPIICGTMSEEGEYLVAWDQLTNEVQVREYSEI